MKAAEQWLQRCKDKGLRAPLPICWDFEVAGSIGLGFQVQGYRVKVLTGSWLWEVQV